MDTAAQEYWFEPPVISSKVDRQAWLSTFPASPD
jgi:hypothetical protein